jgi:rod shape-determining protein MreC
MVGGIYSAIGGVTSYVGLGKANKQLEAENELLRSEIHEMKRVLAANRIDTIQFEGLKRSRYHFVGAQVINVTTNHSHNLLTLDKGTKDGIKPEMGVVCSSGVVGIVYLTSEHYSIVMPIINMKSRISCQLKEHLSFGTIEWQFGSAEYAYMTGLPLHIKQQKTRWLKRVATLTSSLQASLSAKWRVSDSRPTECRNPSKYIWR